MSRRCVRRSRVLSALCAAVVAVLGGVGPALAAPPRDQQWYLDRIGALKAQAAARGEDVLVGMFLSSVNTGHPDLAGRVRPGKYVGAGGAVKDRPVSIDTPGGRDADTGLAGLVVARGGTGVLGVAPRAEIQPISGPVGEEKVSQALRWLVDQGAKVIDMSGGFTVDGEVRGIDGIRYALAKDVVVIMDVRRADRLPASATVGVLVVGGVDEKGARDGANSFGSRINLAAPGATLGLVGLSGEPRSNGRYDAIAAPGDQQACALVAGVVALVRSRHPGLNAASVIDRLLSTARDAGPPGRDTTFGAGIVDAAAAVTADRPAVTANPLGDPGPPVGGGLLTRGAGKPLTLAAGAVCCMLIVGLAVLLVVRFARRASAW